MTTAQALELGFSFDERTHTFRNSTGAIIPSVTQVLEAAGLRVDPETLHPKAKFNYDRKGDIGVEAHKACWYLDEDDLYLDSLEGHPAAPYVLSYTRFRDSRPDYKPLKCEHILTAEIDGMGFGGIIDRIADMSDGQYIVDLKTPVKPEKAWAIQLSGYEILYGMRVGRAALHLYPDGKPGKLIPYTSPHDHEVFVSALRIAWWKLGKK